MKSLEFGILGAGTMGAALAGNLAGRGVRVGIADKNAAQARTAALDDIVFCADAKSLAGSLERPRAILMMVPAGTAVDEAIGQALDGLEPGDILIDGGNSHPEDTARRFAALAERGIDYLGCGISGGEDGARRGASIMAGGAPQAVARIAPILTKAAAVFDGEPCFAHVGPAPAGHLVKIVHNGIEYAEMQLLAEAWIMMRDGMGLGLDDIRARFGQWRKSQIGSFLIEAAWTVLGKKDTETGLPAIDIVADRADQKGTGAWASELALGLGVPAPTLAAAVFARNLSATRKGTKPRVSTETGQASETLLLDLEGALLAAKIAAFIQGFSLIEAAMAAQGWATDLAAIARVWRAGCIIRSVLLGPLAATLNLAPSSAGLLASAEIGDVARGAMPALRRIVSAASLVRLPIPALGSALAWLEAQQAGGVGADLIAAERDFFGAHGFERTDRPGRHRFDWKAQ